VMGMRSLCREMSANIILLLKALLPVMYKLTLRLLMSYIYIYIYIYIYNISSLRVNDLTPILLKWRKW